MGFVTDTACSASFSPWAAHHNNGLVFFGLALATFDFLDGFAWLRGGCLRLRSAVYRLLAPTIRPLSAGDSWLISVALLVAALVGSQGFGVAGWSPTRAPTVFFVWATLGLALATRFYLVIYAIEKNQLSRPPRRTSDWLLARVSTELSISPAFAEPLRPARQESSSGGLVRLMVLVPLTYVWQAFVALFSFAVWLAYSPILLLYLVPGKLLAYGGVAIAAAGFLLPKVCR